MLSDEFCNGATTCLKALVEEWGPDLVKVVVPEQWRDAGYKSLGPVQLSFHKKSTVNIMVIQHGQVLVNREAEPSWT
jgi:hypothetical protein